jgi:hypothetical protein
MLFLLQDVFHPEAHPTLIELRQFVPTFYEVHKVGPLKKLLRPTSIMTSPHVRAI